MVVKMRVITKNVSIVLRLAKVCSFMLPKHSTLFSIIILFRMRWFVGVYVSVSLGFYC